MLPLKRKEQPLLPEPKHVTECLDIRQRLKVVELKLGKIEQELVEVRNKIKNRG